MTFREVGGRERQAAVGLPDVGELPLLEPHRHDPLNHDARPVDVDVLGVPARHRHIGDGGLDLLEPALEGDEVQDLQVLPEVLDLLGGLVTVQALLVGDLCHRGDRPKVHSFQEGGRDPGRAGHDLDLHRRRQAFLGEGQQAVLSLEGGRDRGHDPHRGLTVALGGHDPAHRAPDHPPAGPEEGVQPRDTRQPPDTFRDLGGEHVLDDLRPGTGGLPVRQGPQLIGQPREVVRDTPEGRPLEELGGLGPEHTDVRQPGHDRLAEPVRPLGVGDRRVVGREGLEDLLEVDPPLDVRDHRLDGLVVGGPDARQVGGLQVGRVVAGDDLEQDRVRLAEHRVLLAQDVRVDEELALKGPADRPAERGVLQHAGHQEQEVRVRERHSNPSRVRAAWCWAASSRTAPFTDSTKAWSPARTAMT